MVNYQRNYQLLKKGADFDEDYSSNHVNRRRNPYEDFLNRAKPKFLYILFLYLISCSFILAAQIFTSSPSFSILYYSVIYSARFLHQCETNFIHFYWDKDSFRFEDDQKLSYVADENSLVSSNVFNGTIFCDRSLERSDICTITGDVRADPSSSSIITYATKFNNDISGDNDGGVIQREKIRPYTRKTVKDIMSTIDELDLVVKTRNSGNDHRCDVRHDVPGLFFSTGGYTGNLFHEFTDGIVPLYITSEQFNGKVVFVILEYHHWWMTKYDEIVRHLSDYDVIDFRGDNRTHCFPKAVVGLRAHEDLQIDPALMEDNKTIADFREFLERTYSSQLVQANELPNSKDTTKKTTKPKLVIMARKDSRMILNQDSLIKMAKKMGFQVEVLVPDPTTNLVTIYEIVNSSDVMVGVHGAALTHFLFLRTGSVFIQIVPIGIDWAAETYCEKPAIKMGLKYIGYKIVANESSLIDKYDENDTVFANPLSLNTKGWNYTKSIYLDHQNVRLNLGRFRQSLLRAHYYAMLKLKNG